MKSIMDAVNELNIKLHSYNGKIRVVGDGYVIEETIDNLTYEIVELTDWLSAFRQLFSDEGSIEFQTRQDGEIINFIAHGGKKD